MYTNNVVPLSAINSPPPGEIVLIQDNRFNGLLLKNNRFLSKNKLFQTQLQFVQIALVRDC